MKPLYERLEDGAPLLRIWSGDCLRVMAGFPTDFSLVFLDPPFNIGQDYGDGGSGDRLPHMEYLTWLHKVIEVSSSKLRPGGAFWLHLPDALVVHGYMALRFCGLVPVNWVILHQEFGQYTDLRFIPSKVHGLYFVRPGGLRVWNVREALEPSLRARIGDKRVRTARFRGSRPWLDVWYGENLGRVQGNNAERWRNHPNQLPELYLARIIRATTRVGDRILDPCLGSGTTAVVGAALWRPVWGVEKNGALCRSAVARIKRGCVRDVGGSLSSGRLLD